MLVMLLTRLYNLQPSPKVISVPRHHNIEDIKERSTELLQRATSPAPTMERTTTHTGSAQENSRLDKSPKATAHNVATVPSTERTSLLKSQDRKDIMPDTLPQRSQDRGVASNRTQSLSLKSQDTRTTEGRRDQNERPTATRTVPAKPWGRAVAPTARTSIPGSRAEVPTTPGAGATGRRTKGATKAVVPPMEKVPVTPRSAPSQSPTTHRRPRLQAANFKYEPKWDFEDKYSLEVGGIQTVSFCHYSCSMPSCSEAPPGRPPTPTLSLTSQAPLPGFASSHPCCHPTLLSSHSSFLTEMRGDKVGSRIPARSSWEGVSPVLEPTGGLEGHQPGRECDMFWCLAPEPPSSGRTGSVEGAGTNRQEYPTSCLALVLGNVLA